MRETVAIKRTQGYNGLVPLMSSAIDSIGGIDLNDGDRVVIKPNFCNFRAPSSGAITHPVFLDGFLEYLRTEYNDLELIVVESDATSSIPDITLKWYGFDRILDKWGASWYNLTHNPTYMKPIDGLHFKEMEVCEVFKDNDLFVTLPKLKTHSLARITVCLKNQFGCIPYKRKVKFHKDIHDVVADCNLAMKPDLCLVDGIISMVGGVAIYGAPRMANLMLAGKDPVAVDSVCANIMGYHPMKVGCIKASKKAGVGTDKFELVGDVNDLASVRLDNGLPWYKEHIYNLGRSIQRKQSLKKYLKRSGR